MTRHAPSIAAQEWRERARCSADPDPVWVTHPKTSSEADKRAAKAVCDQCPVLVQCLRWHQSETNFEGFAAGRTWVCRAPGQSTPKAIGPAWYDTARHSWVSMCIDCNRIRHVRPERCPVDARCRNCRAGDMVTCPDCGEDVPELGLGLHRRNRHRGVA